MAHVKVGNVFFVIFRDFVGINALGVYSNFVLSLVVKFILLLGVLVFVLYFYCKMNKKQYTLSLTLLTYITQLSLTGYQKQTLFPPNYTSKYLYNIIQIMMTKKIELIGWIALSAFFIFLLGLSFWNVWNQWNIKTDLMSANDLSDQKAITGISIGAVIVMSIITGLTLLLGLFCKIMEVYGT